MVKSSVISQFICGQCRSLKFHIFVTFGGEGNRKSAINVFLIVAHSLCFLRVESSQLIQSRIFKTNLILAGLVSNGLCLPCK